MKDKLIEYAELKQQVKELEAKIKALQPEIMGFMEQEGHEQVELEEYGSFRRVGRRTWKYSEDVENFEARLDGMKTEEQQLGTATYKENYYLLYERLRD